MVPSKATFGDISVDGLPLTEFGFQTTPASDIPTCGATPDQAPCSRTEFFERFKQRHPVYATSTTPIYSNAAFQILSYALESITNKTFQSMISEDMFGALSMSSTSLSTPNISLGVIPNDPATSWWSVDTGDEGA
jgi:CubicO group peptidase (beta-lactamase class C family)